MSRRRARREQVREALKGCPWSDGLSEGTGNDGGGARGGGILEQTASRKECG